MALNLMADLIQRGSGEATMKKSTATGRFLQKHALGLMTCLTDVINDTSSLRSSAQEQNRCIRAMEEMINIGKTYIRIARPQVSTPALDQKRIASNHL
jgi:serine/threonine-protein kinase ATR